LSDLRLIYHLAAAQGVGMDQSASSPAFEHLLRRELETFEEVSAPYPASSPMHVFTALAAISLARRSDAKAEQERYWSRASEKLLAVMQSQGWSPQKVVMDYPQMLGEATQRHLAAAASLGHHEAALNLGERVLAVHRMSAAGWMRSLGWSEALARVCPEGPAAKGRTSRDGPTTADRYRSLAMDFLELSTQQLSRSEAHSWQDFDGLLAKTASGLKRRWPQEVAAVRAKAAGAKP
jgi:hypothetical protein